jgi:hypothetical protein
LPLSGVPSYIRSALFHTSIRKRLHFCTSTEYQQTFVVSKVLSRGLLITESISVRSILFPVYLRTQTFLLVGSLITRFLLFRPDFQHEAYWVKPAPLVVALQASLINMHFLLPKMRRIMAEKTIESKLHLCRCVELRLNLPDEQSEHHYILLKDQDEGAGELDRRVARLQRVCIHLNVFGIFATFVYGIMFSRELSLTV